MKEKWNRFWNDFADLNNLYTRFFAEHAIGYMVLVTVLTIAYICVIFPVETAKWLVNTYEIIAKRVKRWFN